MGAYHAGGGEEEDVDGASIGASVGISISPHCKIADSIAIQVSERGNLCAKEVTVGKCGGEAALRVRDLLVGAHHAGSGEEEDVDGATIGASVVVFCRPHHKVADSVTIQISDRGKRSTQMVFVFECGGEAALRVGDLLVGAHHAGSGEEEDVDGAVTVAASIVISISPHCKIADSIAIQVTE